MLNNNAHRVVKMGGVLLTKMDFTGRSGRCADKEKADDCRLFNDRVSGSDSRQSFNFVV